MFFLGSYFKNQDKLFFKNLILVKNKILINKALLMFITYLNAGFLVFKETGNYSIVVVGISFCPLYFQ